MVSEPLSEKKILMVIARDNFRDEEYSYPREIFESNGARVIVASETSRECRGMLGLKVTPHLPIRNVRPNDYDAVVIVGGTGAQKYLWEDADLHAIIQKVHASGKIIGAICLAGVVLARAGILQGKKVTVYKTPESLNELQNVNARYLPESLVIDGNIITADGPRAAKEFGKAIVEALLTGNKVKELGSLGVKKQ